MSRSAAITSFARRHVIANVKRETKGGRTEECPSVGWGVRIMISKRVLGAGAAVAMMFGVADAQAQWFVTPTGPGVLYFGVEGGWTHLNRPTDSVGGFKFKEHFDDGLNAGARAGYEW